jgi:filamentous hemagglutinin
LSTSSTGGSICGGDFLLAAARDIRNESLASTQTCSSVNTSGSTNGNYTALSNQASIVASGALQMSAGRDITDVAGHISAANAGLTAGRDVNSMLWQQAARTSRRSARMRRTT